MYAPWSPRAQNSRDAARKTVRPLLIGICVVTLLASSSFLPGGARAEPIASKLCGTWAMQEVQSPVELRDQRTGVDAALAFDQVRGLTLRAPWSAFEADFAMVSEGRDLARARQKAYSVGFVAGRHTPSRVFDAGSPSFTLASGGRAPAPFGADGSANTVFEAAYDQFVGRLAADARSNGTRLLQLPWYGGEWAELDNGAEVRALPGYSYANWLGAHQRLVDIGLRHAGDDLTVAFPLSGAGPLGRASADLATHIVAQSGPFDPSVFVQATGWAPAGDWGAPNADVEAEMDAAVWTKAVNRGEQSILAQDQDWTATYGHLYANQATVAEVHVASFARTGNDVLASEIVKFADHCAAIAPPTTTTTIPTTTTTTTPPSSEADITGIWAMRQGKPFTESVYGLNIAGYSLRVHWKDIEPQRGQYNWALLDGVLARAKQGGKKVRLAGMFGVGVPEWVGAEWFTGSAGSPCDSAGARIPVPWDANLRREQLIFIRAFAERYRDDPAIAFFPVAGPSARWAELCLPNNTTALPGYSNEVILEVWKEVIDQWLAVRGAKRLSVANSASPSFYPELAADIANYGIAALGRRFSIQWNFLDTKFANAVRGLSAEWAPRTAIGWQLWGATVWERQTVDYEGSLRLGASAGSTYIEVYDDDLRIPALGAAAERIHAEMKQ